MAAEAITPYQGAPPAEQDLVQQVVRRMQLWEESVGKEARKKFMRFYDQYRGFRNWHDEWTASRDRHGGLIYDDARKKWGAQLHIPLSFRTIETIVPRAIANAPKLLYMPRDERWQDNVEAVQMLVDAQQEKINIDLPFQAAMRSGQIYGLGATKTFWDYKAKRVRRMVPMTNPSESQTHTLGEPETKVYFDDPRCESVDIFDLAWDPYAYDVDSCDWIAHKVWLTLDGVLKRLPGNSGQWNTETAKLLDVEAVSKLPGSNQKYDEVMRERLRLSGFSPATFQQNGEEIHELIEYHDGEMVYGVLDRQVLVVMGENPCCSMPFDFYRPIPLEHQMVGIGALEPLEHLQRELNTLRSQRRDLVTLALCAGYAYDATAVDPDDLQFGPAAAIEVDGDPRQALMPLSVKEVPGAGWQEEAAIVGNMNDVSGLTDALDNTSPSASSSTTATEAQLVQAALGRRIELGARRFELEIVRPTAEKFLELDQRKIREARTYTLPQPEPDGDTSRYRWVEVGPGDLEGEFEIHVEGGSMAARNTPQDRADAAQLFNTLSGDWYTNPTKIREEFLKLMGKRNPKAWMRDPEPSVPLMALRFLVQMGYDPRAIAQSVIRAREVSAPQEGEAAEQVAPLSGAPQ